MSADDFTSVLVVDDSAVIRGMITRILEEDKNIKVVATAANGEIALKIYDQHKPDIVVLDIEMPVMDGITALKQLMKKDPNARVLMCSTLTLENAQISLEAMSIGAIDYIPKPTSTSEISGSDQFKARLHELVRAVAKPHSNKSKSGSASSSSSAPVARAASTTPSAANPLAKASPRVSESIQIKPEFDMRPEPPAGFKARALAVGSSTGGPQALFAFFKSLKAKSPVSNTPIFITQHMPPTFTGLLAQHITQQTGITCLEASEGLAAKNGQAILARGGVHMLAKREGTDVKVTLDDGPQENFCKPAVDPMLRSLMPIYAKDILVVVLTGMGQDGAVGAKTLVQNGAFAGAQSQKSSVVWGMPGATANTGCCSFIGTPEELGAWAARYVS